MKKLKDERIMKEANTVTSKMYWYMLPILVLLLAFKLYHGLEPITYALEILCFISTVPYLLIASISKGVLWSKEIDESIREIRNSILSKCFMICFWIIISGEFVLIFLDPKHTIIYSFYLISWFLPALYITIYSIRHGLLIWGGEKRKKVGTKAFQKRVAIGALLFGIIMGAPMLYHDHSFHLSGILWIFGMALGWGIPFYLLFTLMIKKAEKNADKQLMDADCEKDDIYEK